MRFLLLFLLIIQQSLYAQEIFELYTPANGLVDARITNIVQDKKGRMVILTRDGLSIYDGQRFNNYQKLDSSMLGISNAYLFMPDSNLCVFLFKKGAVFIHGNTVLL